MPLFFCLEEESRFGREGRAEDEDGGVAQLGDVQLQGSSVRVGEAGGGSGGRAVAFVRGRGRGDGRGVGCLEGVGKVCGCLGRGGEGEEVENQAGPEAVEFVLIKGVLGY